MRGVPTCDHDGCTAAAVVATDFRHCGDHENDDGTEAASTPLTFYFGGASGSGRKTLRQLEEPHVMINYATALNTPWEGIERLFVDSGGYSFMKGKGEYGTTDAEYLDYVEEHEPEVFAFRDYPCEPDVLAEHDRTVTDHQRMTTERHVDLWESYEDRGLDGTPLTVLQGWDLDEYLTHLDELRDHDALGEYVGIGSVCRRNRETEIRRIITAIREELGPAHRLHAFGVKANVLQFADVVDALDSADSQAYEFSTRWNVLKERGAGTRTWHDTAHEYLRFKRRIDDLLAEQDGHRQTHLTELTDG